MQNAINEAYTNLKAATNQYYAAQIAKIETKFAHDATYETGLVSGEIYGRNDAERMGMMRQRYSELVMSLQKATLDKMGAELVYEICRLEVDRVKLIVEQGGKNE